jgi:hypothetical protein
MANKLITLAHLQELSEIYTNRTRIVSQLASLNTGVNGLTLTADTVDSASVELAEARIETGENTYIDPITRLRDLSVPILIEYLEAELQTVNDRLAFFGLEITE